VGIGWQANVNCLKESRGTRCAKSPPAIKSSVGHTHSWLAASAEDAALWSDDDMGRGDLQLMVGNCRRSCVDLIR
jgi:hypothetical protein